MRKKSVVVLILISTLLYIDSITVSLMISTASIQNTGSIQYTLSQAKPYIDGKYFKTPEGQIVFLRGVLKGGLMDSTGSYERESEHIALENFGFNTLRRFFARDLWLNDPSYRALIKQDIEWAGEHNLYYILSLYRWDHTRGPYDRKGNGLIMPPSDRAWADLWMNIAQELKGYWNIIYEIHNEPGPADQISMYSEWSQAVVDGIRSVDPDTVIIVPFHLFKDGSEFTENPIVGNNIAYDFHCYRHYRLNIDNLDLQYRSDFDEWLLKWNLVEAIQRFPVICGEFGAYDMSDAELNGVRTLCQASLDYEFGWIAHRWPWESDGDFAVLTAREPYQLSAYGEILVEYT